MARGPLAGLRIIEFAGLGPAPFCGMMFSDMGADVVRIDRKGSQIPAVYITTRGRRSIGLDLKVPAAREACLRLLEKADGLIEGFRPGVMERLGLGPEIVMRRNPRLAYGRMTGWGQTGPNAQTAAHDINYIAVSGALHAIGPRERPVPPLNLVGDFGGGALYLAFGLLAAIHHARETGQGQVVDCAMTDAAASLMAFTYGFHGHGAWEDRRGANMLDGGAPYYDVYQCADGAWISLGAIEPQFYDLMRRKLGLSGPEFDAQNDKSAWPALKQKVAEAVAQRTRAEWVEALEGTDVCFAPVLSLAEAPHHPHNVARETFIELDGVPQPAPAPRFSDTPGEIQRGVVQPGAHNREALGDWGFSQAEIEALEASGALG